MKCPNTFCNDFSDEAIKKDGSRVVYCQTCGYEESSGPNKELAETREPVDPPRPKDKKKRK